MMLTLLDYDPKTKDTTTAYGTVALDGDGTLTYGGANPVRAMTCVNNARKSLVNAGNKTPTNAQVLEYLATASAKAKNGRVVCQT